MERRERRVEDSDTDVSRFGYEQTLRRGFSLWSVFALAFAFISPIVALYGIFALSLAAGGPAFWWGFVVVLAGQMLVALVFAEMASVWPLAGGVYQWSRQILGNGFGWFAGWAYMWTLVIAMAAVGYGAASFLAALIGLSEPSPLTLVLLALGVLIIGTFANTFGRGLLKVMVSLSIACEILGSIVIGTVLLLFYRENSLSVVFDAFGTAGETGSYLFGPFLAAIAFIGWAFVGFESAGAVAEEVEHPGRDVPRAVLLSLVLVAAVVMYAGLAIILAIPNLEAVVAGEVGDPITDTLAAKLGDGISRPLFAVIVIGFLASLIAIQAAVSRVVFSFARDRALPGSGFLGRLSTDDRLPVNAILLTAVLTATLFLLANSNIYGTLVSFTTGGFYVAFFFPTLAALVSRLSGRWQPGVFSLGRAGLVVNILALLWLLFEIVNISWPRAPDLPWYQNYGVVIMVLALGVLGAILFLPLQANISRIPTRQEEQPTPDEGESGS